MKTRCRVSFEALPEANHGECRSWYDWKVWKVTSLLETHVSQRNFQNFVVAETGRKRIEIRHKGSWQGVKHPGCLYSGSATGLQENVGRSFVVGVTKAVTKSRKLWPRRFHYNYCVSFQYNSDTIHHIIICRMVIPIKRKVMCWIPAWFAPVIDFVDVTWFLSQIQEKVFSR